MKQHIRNIIVMLTNRCNEKCTYCEYSTGMKDVATLEQFIYTVEHASKYLEFDTIHLTGGEIGLVDTQTMISILDYCKENNYKIKISTNGLFLKKYFDVIKNYPIIHIIYHLIEDGHNVDFILKNWKVLPDCLYRFNYVLAPDHDYENLGELIKKLRWIQPFKLKVLLSNNRYYIKTKKETEKLFNQAIQYDRLFSRLIFERTHEFYRKECYLWKHLTFHAYDKKMASCCFKSFESKEYDYEDLKDLDVNSYCKNEQTCNVTNWPKEYITYE